VHWLNSREAANKAFEKAIAREDRFVSYFAITIKFVAFAIASQPYSL
jgi:hypothetical protein